MKKTAFFLTAALLASSTQAALASQDVIEVYLNGSTVVFDTDPEIVNDRTFVPLRAIVEGFGAEVEWDGETQSISIAKDGIINHLQISSENVSTESEGAVTESVLDAAPYIKDERTMVPLRFISEGFGMTVEWDGENRVISIRGAEQGKGEVALDTLKYYDGFSYIPDFGAYFGIEQSQKSTDEMYYYENTTAEQELKYTELLLLLGFAQVDEMVNDFVTSYGYEKENEQVVTARFSDVFGITVIHKRAEYTGDVTYYEAFPSVPDYGAINGMTALGSTVEADGSYVYSYASESSTSRANEMLTYIDVLTNEGFEQTDMTVTTLTLSKGANTVTIEQSTSDATEVKIIVK